MEEKRGDEHLANEGLSDPAAVATLAEEALAIEDRKGIEVIFLCHFRGYSESALLPSLRAKNIWRFSE
jgi:hypothetical protein